MWPSCSWTVQDTLHLVILALLHLVHALFAEWEEPAAALPEGLPAAATSLSGAAWLPAPELQSRSAG